MKKYAQNRIAESGLTLPCVALFSLLVWILQGLIANAWWPQLACIVASGYLMVELSNAHALIRVRSRMATSVFLVLSSTAGFLFGSLSGGIVQVCFIAMLILLFRTYQDSEAPGLTFYAFLCIGVASLFFVHILFYMPILWLVMLTQLQSLKWRSWAASLIGVATPYWFASLWVAYQQDVSLIADHFSPLTQFALHPDYSIFSACHVAVFFFSVILLGMGVVHFWNKSYEDKIRIRQLYGALLGLALFSIAFLVLQPQHYDVLMRIIIVCASPYVAHLLTLTHTRITNIMFWTVVTMALLLTIASLFMPDWGQVNNMLNYLWSGLLNF
jgi:hypothetical protein